MDRLDRALPEPRLPPWYLDRRPGHRLRDRWTAARAVHRHHRPAQGDEVLHPAVDGDEHPRPGKRPLFIGFEMTNDEQEDRLTALYGEVGLTKVMNGTLQPARAQADREGVEAAGRDRRSRSSPRWTWTTR